MVESSARFLAGVPLNLYSVATTTTTPSRSTLNAKAPYSLFCIEVADWGNRRASAYTTEFYHL